MNMEIKSFCYWSGRMKIIHHVFFKSFLITQSDNFTIDVYIENCDNFDVFFSSYTEEEMKRINIITMNWDDIIDSTLIFHEFDSLRQTNLALLSDYCRILTLIKTANGDKYKYTFYFDMDIVFLKSFSVFLDQKSFVYAWGKSERGKSEIIKVDRDTGEELKYLLEICKTPHPCSIFGKSTEKIHVLSCTLFDPQWLTNEYDLAYYNDDMCQNKMEDYVDKYGSYAVHWHNKWNINPIKLPKSWIYTMYKKFVNIDMDKIMELETKFPHTELTEKIKDCIYGNDDHNIDVTYIFCSVFVKNREIIIDKNSLFNTLFGDPIYGINKYLKFTLNGKVYIINEHNREDIKLSIDTKQDLNDLSIGSLNVLDELTMLP